MNIKKTILILIISCFAIAIYFIISELYFSEAQKNIESVKFEVKQGESVGELITRLEDDQIIRSASFFKLYLRLKGLDKQVNYGEFEVEAPITTARVAQALSKPGLSEEVVTIIPGWNIRDIGINFSAQGGPALGGEGLVFSFEEFTNVVGLPAVNYKHADTNAPVIDLDLKILADKPWYVSYEGYLAPETYRVYKNASVERIVRVLLEHRENQITDKMWGDIEKSERSFFEVLTMASLLEREVRGENDRKKVADIFWRRYDINWALQADSTVHYAVNKSGDVYTTSADRDTNSAWNTYKYPGLPLGPICNPSLESIEAAIYPDSNKDWYFLTDVEGTVYYAKDLDEHNWNRQKYLN